MVKLSNKQTRILSISQSLAEDSTDIKDTLMPFFRPIISDFSGQMFDPQKFCEKLKEDYSWNLTTDVIRDFIPKFIEKKWLEQCGSNKSEVAYRVCEIPKGDTEDSDTVKLIKRLGEEFGSFERKLKPLQWESKDSYEMAEILIKFLLDMNIYSIEDVGNSEEKNKSSELDTSEKYLCARFIDYLACSKPDYFSDISKITSVYLLLELVQDIENPTALRAKRPDVVFYLDSPVALRLLRISGKYEHRDIKDIVEQLQAMDIQIRIFRHSVRELQRIIRTALSYPPNERKGSIADAMRSGEVKEDYVRHIADSPDKFLRELQIGISEREFDAYPQQHHVFSDEMHEKLKTKIPWTNQATVDNDAESTTLIMRMRAKDKSYNYFSAKHILITLNPNLANLVKKFCYDEELIERHHIPPIIHQSTLATAVWLRTGFKNKNKEYGKKISKNQLLAACERVRVFNLDVSHRMKEVLKKINPSQIELFEVLASDDRSVQTLKDKTLNSAKNIITSDAEKLMKMMEDRAMEKANRKVEEEKKKTKEERKKTEKERKEKEDFHSQLKKSHSEIRTTIKNVLEKANKEINCIKWFLLISLLMGLFLLIVSLPPLSIVAKVVKALILLLLFVVGFGVIKRLVFSFRRLNKLFESYGRYRIKSLIKDFAFSVKTENILYSDGKFVLDDEVITSAESSSLDDKKRNLTT